MKTNRPYLTTSEAMLAEVLDIFDVIDSDSEVTYLDDRIKAWERTYADDVDRVRALMGVDHRAHVYGSDAPDADLIRVPVSHIDFRSLAYTILEMEARLQQQMEDYNLCCGEHFTDERTKPTVDLLDDLYDRFRAGMNKARAA